MNELQVIVTQDPGTVSWNFEDLKAALHAEMQVYQNTVYGDDTIKAAQEDVAMLRKLRKAVDDRRKEIKNRCLEPYSLIEQQARELTNLIDQPIELIDTQVKDYEYRRRDTIRKNILAYIAQVFSDAPKTVADRVPGVIYDNRWENKTAKESTWKQAIETQHDRIMQELRVLAGLDADYRQEAYNVYVNRLNLTDAMDKAEEMKRQKEILLERQRQREEEQQRRRQQQEIREAEEKARQDAQKAAQDALSQQVHIPEPQQPQASTSPAQPQIDALTPHKNEANINQEAADEPAATIRLYGATPQQIDKIVAYINFIGVRNEVTGR